MTVELDSQLRAASEGVANEMLTREIPEFVPSHRRSPSLAIVVAAACVVAVGWLAMRDPGPTSVRVEAASVDGVSDTTHLASPPPSQAGADEPPSHPRTSMLAVAAPGEVLVPLNEAWNADATMVLAYSTGGPDGAAHKVLDASTGTLVGRFSLNASDIEQVYWDPLDRQSLLYLEENRLVRLDVVNQTQRVIGEFPQCSALEATSLGSALSWDGRQMAFSCLQQNGDALAALYHLDTNELVVSDVDSSFAPPRPLPSGDGVVMMLEPGTLGQFDLTFNASGTTITSVDNSVQLSQTAGGHDIAIAPSFDGPVPATLMRYDLTTGESRVLIGVDDGQLAPPSGIQVSGAARTTGGRAAVTVRAGSQGATSGQLLVIDTDTGDVVVQIGHLNSGTGDPYWGRAFLSESPDGTRVLYSTDMSDSGAGLAVVTFEAD